MIRIVCMALLIAATASAEPPPSGKERGTLVQLEATFQKAIQATGADYLTAEQTLRDAGSSLTPVLAKRRTDDPLSQLLATVLAQELSGGAAQHQAVLRYFQEVPKRLERTALGKPSPSGVAAWLEKHHADRVAELLALRLVKSAGWPHWQTFGVLLYLERCPGAHHPTVTFPLIQFIATATGDTRKQALQTLVKMNDPSLSLQLERARKSQHEWPADLTALEQSLKAKPSTSPAP